MNKIINWNNAKNEILKKVRNVSFEEVLEIINRGNIIDIIPHYNPKNILIRKL